MDVLTPAASAQLEPSPDADPIRDRGVGTLHMFGGVLFDALGPKKATPTSARESIEILEKYARVLILEEGATKPKEAIISMATPVTPEELDAIVEIPAEDLIAESNLAASHVMHDEEVVCDDIRRMEFVKHISEQDALEFLLTNLVAKGSSASFNLFGAPGGNAVDGVGVYLNTWL